MQDPRLDPVVHPHAFALRRFRGRLAVAGCAAAGTLVALEMWAARSAAPSPPPPPPPQLVPTITTPPPLVITIEHEAPVAPAPPVPLGCPVIARADLAIGRAVAAERIPRDEPIQPVTVVAGAGDTIAVSFVLAAREQDACRAGHAMCARPGVWVSDDDGATFRREFVSHTVTAIAIGRDDVLYARADQQLGMRHAGRVTWREVSVEADTGSYVKQLAVLGDDLVWFAGTRVARSRDHGNTWREVEPSAAWSMGGPSLFTWRGALYEASRYQDRCGIDDHHVYRLDAHDVLDHRIFSNNPARDVPVLTTSDDVGTSWRWRVRCYQDHEGATGRCSQPDPGATPFLIAGGVRPREGGRTLGIWDGALVELCGNDARQIYRAFPFDRIDAVDSTGRPLVVRGRSLYRWSATHGWRTLFTAPSV